MTPIYIWNLPLWKMLWGSSALPAAILLAGPAGVGKAAFSGALAQSALCSTPAASHEACGNCQSCRLIEADSHPDLRVLEAGVAEEAEPSDAATPAGTIQKWISVDRIRELRDFFEMSAHLGGRKVIVIRPADRLYPNAANALLKMLEEPSPATVFILVSARPQQLLPTLRSRCFRLDFRVPSTAQAMTWLETRAEAPEALLAHAAGAPLAALELAESGYWKRREQISRLLSSTHPSATDLVHIIANDELAPFATLLFKWCCDLLSARLTGRIRYNPDYAVALKQLAAKSNVLSLQRFMRELTDVLRYLEHPLNPRLVCEKLALGYVRALSSEEQ